MRWLRMKLGLTLVGLGLLCNLCGGEATTCLYKGVKDGEPVTVGTSIVVSVQLVA